MTAQILVVFEIRGFFQIDFSINLGFEKFSNVKYPNPVIGWCQGTPRSCKFCLQL